MRHLAATVTVLAGLLAPAPAAAATAGTTTASTRGEQADVLPLVSRLYVLERTTRGPATLRWTATYNAADGQQDLLASVFVRDKGGRVVDTEFPMVISQSLPSGGVEAYAGGRRYDCSTTSRPESCDLLLGGAAGYTQLERVDAGGPGQATRMFVALQGAEVRLWLDPSSRGWRLRRITPAFDVVQAQESDAVGANVPPAGAEVFFSATGRGGDRGSVAIGQPPCGLTRVGGPVSLGAGTVELVGGREKPDVTCPLHDSDTGAVGDYARARTSWRLQGFAAGSTFGVAQPRLVIIRRA